MLSYAVCILPYLLVRVGHCHRDRFNRLLDLVEHRLQIVLMNEAFRSTVEVKGCFALWDKATASHHLRRGMFSGTKAAPPSSRPSASDCHADPAAPSVQATGDEDAVLALELEAELLGPQRAARTLYIPCLMIMYHGATGGLERTARVRGNG